MFGYSVKKERSNSSASTTAVSKSLLMTMLLSKFLAMPPMNAVILRYGTSRWASIDVVVVFPCVPATATVGCPLVKIPNTSERLWIGMLCS